jgi:hypothetical protein
MTLSYVRVDNDFNVSLPRRSLYLKAVDVMINEKIKNERKTKK